MLITSDRDEAVAATSRLDAGFFMSASNARPLTAHGAKPQGTSPAPLFEVAIPIYSPCSSSSQGSSSCRVSASKARPLGIVQRGTRAAKERPS